MAKRKAKVQKTECVSCGTCVKVCPVGAISIKKGCLQMLHKIVWGVVNVRKLVPHL